MRTLFIVLFPIICVAQINEVKKAESILRVKVENNKVVIRFLKSTKYHHVEWITFGNPNDSFSDIFKLDLTDHRYIKVEDMAIFWLIGPDTVAVKVLSPLDSKHRPVVMLNGVDLKTGSKEKRELWDYNSVVPEINSLYEEIEVDN